MREYVKNESGEPELNADGYGIIGKETDEKGQIIREAYFSLEETPVIAKSLGYAAVEKDYNDAQKVIAERYFGTDGNPLALEGKGYAGVGREYDKAGNVIDTTNLFGIATSEYDDENREIYQAWFDASGSRINKKDNSSFLTKEYLKDGNINVVRTRYYDSNGKPVNLTSGYAVLEVYNNSAGKKIGEAYFDEDLNPVYRTNQPYVRLSIEVRDDGVTETNYYNTLGEIVKTEEK